MKLGKLVLTTMLAAVSATAYAGNFVTLTNGDGVSVSQVNGGLKQGRQNQAADQLYIESTGQTFLTGYSNTTMWSAGGTGDVVPTSITYRAFSGTTTVNTGTLTLLDWRRTDNLVLLPGISQLSVYDFVYRDSFDNKLVFGSRWINRTDNNQEVNFTYRYGFTGFTAAAAWTFVTNSDLRMYQAGKTNSFSFATSTSTLLPYNADAIRMQGDYSVTEGNPWSSLNLIKTDAKAYTLNDTGIGYWQAGEEGQAVLGYKIAGFVPTNDDGDVPIPTWVLLLMTATLFAIKFKNEKRFS